MTYVICKTWWGDPTRLYYNEGKAEWTADILKATKFTSRSKAATVLVSAGPYNDENGTLMVGILPC